MSRALRLAGYTGVLLGVAVFALGGFAAAAAPPAVYAPSAAASHVAVPGPICHTQIALAINPSPTYAHIPMNVQVSVTFGAGSSGSCASGDHAVLHNLPFGCPTETAMVFTCTPQLQGTYHVLTTVFAQNTATTVVDTVVVN